MAKTNNDSDRRGEASCLGPPKLLLNDRDLHVDTGFSGDLLLLGSNIWIAAIGHGGKRGAKQP